MPESTDNTKANESATRRARDRTNLQFWLSVWCGTMVAGGASMAMLGWCERLVGASFGFFFGVLHSCVVGSPIIAVLSMASWRCQLSRVQVAMGGVAGAVTGGAVMQLMLSAYRLPDLPSGTFVLSGWIGMTGGAVAGAVYYSRIRPRHDTPKAPQGTFTLRGLFATITVLATISAAVAYVADYAGMRRQHNQRLECRYNLRNLSHELAVYEDVHGVLPPTCVEDEKGHPLLSWRVLALRHSFCLHFGTRVDVDLSQPWDSPTNSRILDSLDIRCLQCPSSEITRPGITHYVAVTGPGTLWQEGRTRRSESDRRILVIEWPDSDIHWTEPRDITVEELLEWLKSKPDASHPECQGHRALWGN